jgi:hypothetical protein
MKLKRKLLLPSLILASVLVLVACGGDGGDDGANAGGGGTGGTGTAAFVPDSASVSVTAFLDFVSSLSTTDDTSEPFLIKDNFVAPTDDTGEPRPLT